WASRPRCCWACARRTACCRPTSPPRSATGSAAVTSWKRSTTRNADRVRMRRALAVAAAAGPDVPIGAVVYGPDGTELAAAHNAREATGDPTAHAELLALRSAAAVNDDGWRLDGC